MLGIPKSFRCILVVSPFVLVETAFFSNVSVVCEVDFSYSDCEVVEPQTVSPENAMQVWLWKVRRERRWRWKHKSLVDCARMRSPRWNNTW